MIRRLRSLTCPAAVEAIENSDRLLARSLDTLRRSYDARRQEMLTLLILYGPNVPHGTIAGARLIDIGPTIASWLGLPMPQATGAPLRITSAR